MKVEIWSDYVCPFCYIGKRKFERALEQFAQKGEIEVVFRSFELNPAADAHSGISTFRMLAAKYGMSEEQAKATTLNVAQQAAAVGLEFRFEGTVETNTFDAHRLVHFAAAKQKEQELSERLFRAYFTDGVNVGDRARLIGLATEIGLDRNEASAMLESDDYKQVVRDEEQEGSQLGIRGVPFYVFDRKYAVSGAQATEVFLDTLNKAWQEKQPSLIQVNEGAEAELCTDGVCAPKNTNA